MESQRGGSVSGVAGPECHRQWPDLRPARRQVGIYEPGDGEDELSGPIVRVDVKPSRAERDRGDADARQRLAEYLLRGDRA